MIKLRLFCLVVLYLQIGEVFANYNGEKTKLFIENEESRPFKFALSPTYLPKLAEAEKKVFKMINKINKQNKNEKTKKYISDFKESGVDLKSDLKGTINFTKNPISSYRMISRFVKDFIPVEEFLKIENEIETLEKLTILKKSTKGFPDDKDLEESIKGLLVIQDFYDLKAKEMARGKLINMETGVRLNPRHCIEIAEFAMQNEIYTLALDWLGVAEANGKGLIHEDINKLRNAIVLKHDENWERNIKQSENHYIYSSKLILKSSLPNNKTKTMKDILWQKYVGNLTNKLGQQLDFNLFALCKGAKFLSAKQESSLFCWLDSKRHTYWIINPLKVELKSRSPHVSLIHDVLPNSYINQLIKTASKIQRRRPREEEYNSPTTNFGWLHPEGFPNIPIETRTEMLFNLKTGKDKIQVNSYTSGSWLHLHLDVNSDENEEAGEIQIKEKDISSHQHLDLDEIKDQEISSNTYYLTDVEEGGATVFPALGIKIQPIKGSVLMWYNLHLNGRVDKRVVHASCPVVFGHKWSTVKVAYFKSNWLKRPCHLDKNK